jgi:hypothetical protein
VKGDGSSASSPLSRSGRRRPEPQVGPLTSFALVSYEGSPVEKLWARGISGLTHDIEAGVVEHAGRTSSAASTTRVRTVVTLTIKG